MSQADQKQGPAAPPAPVAKKFEESTVNQVLANVAELQNQGGLKLPPDYSPENAVRAAWLNIIELKDKNDKPAIEVCTKASIANSMLDMVLQGLSPVKKQCYFIVYGNKLQMARSYIGTLAVARRVAGVEGVISNVIYEGDEFIYEIDKTTGDRRIVKHEQALENIDGSKIKGVYAVVALPDGKFHLELMTISQVRAAWNQGQTKGKSPAHTNFPDEMAKKSCIGRALKLLIGGTDDSGLFDDDDIPGDVVAAGVAQEIKANANRTPISMKTLSQKQIAPAVEIEQDEPATVNEENPPY